MNNPKVPVSWGELFDKITILQIKSEKLCSPQAIKNVNTELHMLSTIIDEKVPNLSEAKEFEKELKLINVGHHHRRVKWTLVFIRVYVPLFQEKL